MSPITQFMEQLAFIFGTGQATEHSYRSAFEKLFSGLGSGIHALNEPKRVECGAPDFIISKNGLTIGHVETKDIDVSLRNFKGANKDQLIRYRKALPNLIYTNGLDWDFYRDGVLVESVRIGELDEKVLQRPHDYEKLLGVLDSFLTHKGQKITSPKVLAEIMAGKAALIKDVLTKAVSDEEGGDGGDLSGQYLAFKQHLIHDVTPSDFSDIYAETIAYGMFAARLHDHTLETFSRAEALELLPKSNPFLKSLFGYIAGPELDDRLKWIIDDLADVFASTDINRLMRGFGSLTGRQDPFLHFYETFLAAYNPDKRKARGVWYTPEPVVNFIVRAVDSVLQTEFGLEDGIADLSKITVDWDSGQNDKKGKPIKFKKEVHRVQILDPATGTGTFLAEAIKQIAPKVKATGAGAWSKYIEQDLIPRLHGFELLMASYAMCHTKLDMVLTELGYKPTDNPPRLSVFLTNSLEEGERDVRDLFMAQWLTREAREANTIKRQAPIMCVIGNPPYSGESANKGEWISGLLNAYKVEPGGKQKLQERNSKWLNDDYVKFIRLAEQAIAKNGDGVLGYITNNGYLDNPTFRGMRWHLLTTFDKIFVLDLHGSSKKKETSPDGSPDKNVFDIQQGVSIIIAIRQKSTNTKREFAKLFHRNLWGSRSFKYEALWGMELSDGGWTEILPTLPNLLFTPQNQDLKQMYDEGFSIVDFMPLRSVGIVTARDALTIDMDKDRLWARINNFREIGVEEARTKYKLGPDAQDWKVEAAQKDIKDNFSEELIVKMAYRPYDVRWTYYTGTSRGFHCRPRAEVMRHMAGKENLALCIPGQSKDGVGGFVVASVAGHKSFSAYDINSLFPLYVYSEDGLSRKFNFEPALLQKMQKIVGIEGRPLPSEVEIFDYIYAILNWPSYKAAYSEFLKSNFPKIPWPQSPDFFNLMVSHGKRLREIHLLVPGALGSAIYPFLGEGDATVDNVKFNDGKIWINAEQYFDNIDPDIWSCAVGGYQPLAKWLKDRKGYSLSYVDIKYYQSIIKSIAGTLEIRNEMSEYSVIE
ncbi:DNA methyltransferase [Pseudomonas sp. CCM 7891]|uniref:site-specific DNA-methyltransferase (adenine-specific) n=1 Tax=Pseudomonas karstica TaxID=1055468 RepID=A0A7X2UYQ0_9PSED|nr:type ISP restriction/modification enzyme [Pseudomonas karstica]MTD19708.1 DNA methyltransferase [Pseudomonas karstica]